MKIGLTFDLKEQYVAEGFSEEEAAEFDRDDTIDYLERAINYWGHETDRIGRLSDLVKRLCRGDRWDLVFNIAEGHKGFGRESQVPAVLDAYEIPYTFSDPLVLAVTLHKPTAKTIVRSHGVPTPDFFTVEDSTDIDDLVMDKTFFSPSRFNFPLFVKPVAEGTGKGIGTDSLVHSIDALKEACSRIISRFKQPALVEKYLPSEEVTVGILGCGRGAKVIGVMGIEVVADGVERFYSYGNKYHYEERVAYTLVNGRMADWAAEVALRAWQVLGCRDAGRVDLKCNGDGRPYFLEVNPLPGINPYHSDLPILCKLSGMSYEDLIGEILKETIKRIGK